MKRCTFLLLLFWALFASAQDDKHVRLTNLPHVYINTFTGNSITSKTVMVYARMWYVDEEDKVTFYDSLQVRVRGNSTASLAKKPYKLKFHEQVKLLGKGRANFGRAAFFGRRTYRERSDRRHGRRVLSANRLDG